MAAMQKTVEAKTKSCEHAVLLLSPPTTKCKNVSPCSKVYLNI